MIKPNVLFLLSLLFAGAGAYYITYQDTAIAPFTDPILTMAVCLSAWALADRLLFYNIDTIYEIKKGNIAYAVVLLAIAYIIGSSVNVLR